MLILTRRISESVMIDDHIQVIVLGKKDDNIILGFKAPRAVPVHREEVYLRNKKFNLKMKEDLSPGYSLKSKNKKNKAIRSVMQAEME